MIRPPPWSRRWGSAARMSVMAGQVGGDDVLDLVVGQFLGGAEQAVAGVADDSVDPAEPGRRRGRRARGQRRWSVISSTSAMNVSG